MIWNCVPGDVETNHQKNKFRWDNLFLQSVNIAGKICKYYRIFPADIAENPCRRISLLKECAKLGLAISPRALFFCKYFIT